MIFPALFDLKAFLRGDPHFSLNVLTLEGDTSNCFRSAHSHDEIGIVAKGTLQTILNDSEEIILQEGDMILIRAQTTFAVQCYG